MRTIVLTKEIAARCVAAALVCGFVSSAVAQAPSPTPTPGLAKGDPVQPFDAEGIDGAIRHVSFKTPTVVLFFLSSCSVCHRMIPLWNQAYERRPKGLDVVAVMLDQEAPGFFATTPISFPVVRAPGQSTADRRAFSERFKIQSVPVTLRVGPGGKVEDVGLGALDPIRLGALFHP